MLSMEMHVKLWRLVRGPFLFPLAFPGHACEWEQFSFTQAGCLLCGAEHRCQANSSCEEVQDDDGQITCAITGCVTREKEQRPEWGALERTQEVPQHQQQSRAQRPPAKQESACDSWLFVNAVVKEILDSQTTQECRAQENRRLYSAQISALHKEIKRQKETHGFVNMLQELIRICTDSVCNIMLKYNSQHTYKILNNDSRRREFACSMLYLMRNGVSCRGECILPKIPTMHTLLPLESCLPEAFKIRSKSITEGENLLKLEIRRIKEM